jgi:hypothetical protein
MKKQILFLTVISYVLLLFQTVAAQTVTYYFNSYSVGDMDGDEANIVDGSTSTACNDNNNGHHAYLDGNTCVGTNLGTITKVELRVYHENNYDVNSNRTCYPELIPEFLGSNTGSTYSDGPGNYDGSAGYPAWGSYFNITADAQAPATWTWSDVQNLDCDVVTNRPGGAMNVYQVEIRVTYSSGAYCTHNNTNTSSYYISDFSTTGGSTNISNTSSGFSTNGYGDFTSQIVSQGQGNSVSFTIVSGNGTMNYGIWIDWNEDGDFSDTGEEVHLTSSMVTSTTGTITVPGTASIGDKRMRVTSEWMSGSAVSCVGSNYSECEDYTFTVSGASTCPNPSALSAGSITTSQADLSWTENGTATQWDIELGTSGFSPTGTPTQSGVTNPYTYTGLSASTDYEYYVRADCGGGDYSSWVGPYSFTTACGAITPPWLEDFSSFLPTCWSEATGLLTAASSLTYGSSDWSSDEFANNSSNTQAANLNICCGADSDWIISPSIDLGDGSVDYQLEFDLALTDWLSTNAPEMNGTDDKFAVVISTDNGATWTSVNTLQMWDNAGSPFVYNDISYTGEHIIIDLTGYTGTVKFGFYGESTVSNADNDLFIDNVEVIEIPTCPQPVSLTATNILPDQADLTWTEFGSATQWDIELGTSGFSPTGTPTQSGVSNPYTYTGLTGATDYDFYVRADCGGGDLSDWSGPYTFTTADPYMVYTSSTVTQNNTDPINRGSVDQEVICIEVVTTNPTSPLDITQFDLNTNGSTSPGTDILNAKLYYTGTTGTFGTGTQFGTTEANPNGNFTISGTQALAEGTNYFWLTYDINSSAALNDFVDAQCTSITVDASAETPTDTNPTGERQILNVYLMSDPNTVSTCTGVFYDSGNETGEYINNETYTKTFQSGTPGSALEFDFTAFETESVDDLIIYDGPDDTYPVIGTYNDTDGTNSPGTITSSGAYLTFYFDSDFSDTYSGWEADISCVPITMPDCPTLDAPADTETDVCPGSVNLQWISATTGFAAVGFKLYVGTTAAANELINGIDIGNVTSYELSNLDGNTQFYWKVLPYNVAGTNTSCGTYSFTTLNIGITGTNSPVTTCDNSASLTATGNGTITWYDQPTGGSPIGTGSPFTASFNGNTTFYVAAESTGGGTEYGGMPANTSGTSYLGTSDEIGIVFNATEDFTLETVDIYPVGTGTVTIALLNDAGNEIANSGTINISGGDGSVLTVTLDFGVSVGTNYKLVLRSYSGITDLYRDFTTSYPYDSPSGALSVTGGWWDGSSGTNYYFYNLGITSGCISAREPVEVIHTADPVSISADGPTTFLDGNSVDLTASSTTAYSYTWSPATGLNTTTGATVTASPNTTTTYTVTGSDGGGCQFAEDITVTVTYPCTGLGTGHTPIASLPFSETSTTCGEVDDITSSNATICGSTSYYTGEDVVYSFTPSSDGLVTIDLTSTGTYTGIMLYDDCPMSGQGGSCMGYSQSSAGNESLCVSVEEDVTYYLVIDSFDSPDCNPFTINISAPDPVGVPGDLPCDATPIAIGGIQSGNNACASGIDEPTAASCWTTGSLNTVWYSFEAPASGSVKIRTILSSLTATQIAVYQGVCNNLTLVSNGCNEDATGTCSGTEDFSDLELTSLTPSNIYYIRVDGENDLTGSFDLQIIDGADDWPSIPQQDCSSATLVCAQQTVVGDPGFVGAGSTCDYTTPYGCFSFGTQNNTVWYEIDIETTGILTFEIVPNLSTTDYDWALIDVTGNASACDEISAGTLSPTRCNFSGTSGTTGLSSTASNTSEDAGGVPFCTEVSATAGDTYYLLIWNWSGNNTGFTLDLSTTPAVYDSPDQVTWSGGASTDWFDPINWGGCVIPSCGIDAIIVNGPTNQPVISAAGAECANITVESGASLTIDAGYNLNVCENLNNSGSLNADPTSTILMNHASNDHEINGSLVGANALGNLNVAKAGGSVTFMQDIEIAGNLTTTNSTSIINTNGRNVTIGGDFIPFANTFTNIGTSGKLIFNGSASQSYNPGGTLILNSVTMNNSGAGVVLNNDMLLGGDGILTFTQGIVETGSYRVELANTNPNAVTFGNSNSYVNGVLRRYIATNSGDYNFPVGTATAYRPAKLTNNSLTGIAYLDAEFLSSFTNSGSLITSLAVDNTIVYQEVASEGIWNIVPDAAPGSGTYDISLYFDDGQGYDVSGNPIGDGFAGLTDNQFAVLKRPSGSIDAGDWIGETAGTIPADGAAGRLISDGFAKRSGISAFSEFGIGKDNTVLPIELLEFYANCREGNVILSWLTASELNNDYFTLYRSYDGKNYTEITNIQGQGNSNQMIEYSFVDENPGADKLYYRLNQTDYDGTTSQSDIVFVNCKRNPGSFNIVPNPFKEEVFIMFDEPTRQTVKLRINDMLGNIVFEANIPEGRLQYRISELSNVVPGSYSINLIYDDAVITKKLIKM